jgi:hypothetical protein
VKLSNLKWKTVGDAEAFSEGVLAPERIIATARGHGPDYDLEVEIGLERDRYIVTSLKLHARKGGAVTSEGVTHVPVKQILRFIVGEVLAHPLVSGWATRHPASLGPTDEALQRVAAVYRMAHLMGLPPTESVAQDLDLPRSTAGRWVSMARQRGFLGKAEPRKAGERARRKR